MRFICPIARRATSLFCEPIVARRGRIGYNTPMRLRAFLSAVCALPLALAIHAEDMPSKTQTAHTFKGKATHEFKLEYLLHLPASYQPGESKRWPLILFLHGAGERGSNVAKVGVHGPPKVVKTNPEFPFVVVSPQCPAGQIWSDEALLALLDEITATHKVDEKRIYLTGLSMGGYGSWSLGLRHPKRFAAVAPICGGGDTIPVLLANQSNSAALKKLPVWAFHGAKDEVVPLSESERMVAILKRHGNPNVKLTVYPEAGHDSWTETYKNQELYDWLLQHRRD
jgi:predicted peptidase